MLSSYVALLVSLVALTSGQVPPTCPAEGCKSADVAIDAASTIESTDHFYLAGLFSQRAENPENLYECGPVVKRGLVNTEAFFWAINRYKMGIGFDTANPPIDVGGFVIDSCSRTERVIENIFSFETCRTQYSTVSPRNTLAYVGPDKSAQAMAANELLSDMKRTLVTPAATSPALTMDDDYLLRTVPSDAVEMMQMVEMLYGNEGIKNVLVIYSDSAYGMGLMKAFKEAAEMKGTTNNRQNLCINKMIDASDLNMVVKMLEENLVTKIVVLLMTGADARRVLVKVDADTDVANRFQFIGTSSWGREASVKDGISSAESAITFSLDSSAINIDGDVAMFWQSFFNMKPQGTDNVGDSRVNTHNPVFTKFWEEEFGCSMTLQNCDWENQNLNTKIDGQDTYVPYTLLAVKAIINGVKDAALAACNNGIHLCSNLLNGEQDRGTRIRSGILNANSNGQRFFSDDGDAATFYNKYRINQIQNGQYENIQYTSGSDARPIMVSSACMNSPCLECGELLPTTPAPEATTTTKEPTNVVTLSPERQLAMLIDRYFKNDTEFTGVWRENQMRKDSDTKTRFENGQDWIIALGVLAGLGIVCVLVFEIYILYKLMGTKIGKQWRTMWLGQLLLLGLFLCYLTLFAYLFTPTKATCGITRFGVGVSYSICFAVLLVKLMVLLTSKTSADTLIPGDVDSPNYLRGIYQFLMFMFVVGVQIVIAIQWMIQIPPDAVQVMSNNGDMVWICNHYTWSLQPDMGWENMQNFVRTEFENHLLSLVYIMFLIVLTVIVSMKAHGIITNHRESVFIGIAAGFSIPVWIAWGLVGALNKDHAYAHEFGDACLAFGLFTTATIILFAMFLPKVRQLVNMGVEGIYLEDDRDTYYAGSVIMAPPSYKSRPSSVVYVNNGMNGYNDPVVIGDQNAVHLKHPGSNYSAPVYVKRPESTIGGSSGKVLRMTGDLTGKHPRESKKSTSEAGYVYAGSGYGTYRKSQSEMGGTMRRAHSSQDLGAL